MVGASMTMISESAVEILSQIDSSVAINAKPTHKAAKAQTPVIVAPFSSAAQNPA
jgi:hypothetical protein